MLADFPSFCFPGRRKNDEADTRTTPLAGLRVETISLFVHIGGRGCTSHQQDTMAKGHGLIFVEREVERRGFGVEDVLTEWVGGEEAIATRVPVGRVVGVSLVVKDGDRQGVAAGGAGEDAPASTCAPGCVALLAFAGQIDTGGSGHIAGLDGRGPSAGVGKGAALLIRRLEKVGDANAEQSFFIVVKNYMPERAKG